MKEFINELIHADFKTITFQVMAVRAIIVFLVAVAMVRLGDKRFFGKTSIFEIIIALIWGSLASRAISGNSKFLPTIGACILLVFLHWLLSFCALRLKKVGWFFKGTESLLIKDGKPDFNEMRKLNISEKDLMEEVRSNGKLDNFEEVKEAYFERNGKISVIPKKKKEVKVLEVKVEKGVEVVRIEVEK